ncbi:ATP-binding protein [Roseococcus pinisoli]|uniref:ATP-binding protein n=1 Tax=Roseococcus pinisoli TaxID=2835040 RepID=UPI0020BF3C9C|nr:hypothetical protein [Roseococcus pinisoli]
MSSRRAARRVRGRSPALIRSLPLDGTGGVGEESARGIFMSIPENMMDSFISSENVKTIHVVVYGVHSQDWTNAFAPESELWHSLPQVGQVSCIEADPGELERLMADSSLEVVAIPLMEEHADRLPPRVARFHPSRPVSDLLRNKRQTLDYAAAQGFGHWCPEVYAEVSQIRFPCIIKRVDLNASAGVDIAHSRRGLAARLGSALELPPDVVVQAFVYGSEEYATYLVMEEGEILWDATFCYEMEFSDVVRRPGTAPAQRVATPGRILAQFRDFLVPLRYSGPCNVDYKIRPNGEAAIFEVNPRLGGSLMKHENLDLRREAVALILDRARCP